MKRVFKLLVILLIFVVTAVVILLAYKTISNNSSSKTDREEKSLPKFSDMCPECRYLYTIENLEYGDHIYDFIDEAKNVLEENETEAKWKDVVSKTNKKVFFGVVLSEGTKGKIERAFVCGVKDEIPFCIESTKHDEEQNKKNLEIIQLIYNDKCTTDNGQTRCAGTVSAFMDGGGGITLTQDNDECSASGYGFLACYQY